MAEKLLTALVFSHDLFSAAEANAVAVRTGAAIPGTAWTQQNTKGDVSVSFGRETLPVGNDQEGDTAIYSVGSPVSVTIPFSKYEFDILSKYAKLDPGWSSGDTNMLIKENKGTELTGFSLLIYAKDTDSENTTDTPDPTNDENAIVLLNLIADAGTDINFNNDQGIIEVTFTGVAYTETGAVAAKGVKATQGTLTVS